MANATAFERRHGGAERWWPPTGDHVFLYKLNPLRFDYFDRFVETWDGVRVLDVGCGGGYACEHLARRRAIVCGTDLMAEAIEEARRHATQEALSIQYQTCTVERLPFDDGSMDAVTCFDVLEHVPDKPRLLTEMRRVLKPGGWLFFDTFNKTFWARLAIVWLGEVVLRKLPRGTHHWPWFIRPADLRQRIEDAGFASVEFAGFRRAVPRKRDFPVHIVPDGHTAIMYFGAARKAG